MAAEQATTFSDIHTNRERAESFGGLAEQYDRTRPGYPDALLDDLVALGPVDALDIGCGTGKAAVPLAARGVHVLGVEIDDRMAEVARGHGIPVEVSRFEEWDPAGRAFDLVLSGQAWHWVDARRGAPLLARIVRPEGHVALFWNLGSHDDETQRRLDEVYARVAPQQPPSVLRGARPPHERDHDALLDAGFRHLEQRAYPWSQDYTRDEWLAMLATHSDHATMEPEARERLFAAVGDVVDALGGTIRLGYETWLLLASR